MASVSDPFMDFAAQVRGQIDHALEIALQELVHDDDQGCPATLAEAMKYSLLAPGKRLRPLLVLMAADACGTDHAKCLPAACAVEMIHAYSLVHDDLPAMDDDDIRRGRPSCHAQFGEATAILVGDALQAGAFETMARGFEPAVAGRCCLELSRAAGATALVGGQSADLSQEGKAGTLEQLQAIHRRKTGALIRVSLRLGAIPAGADEAALERLDRFGDALGTVFQITDDLLDCQGDFAKIGKKTQKDADRGKLTYPGLLGAETSRRHASRLTQQAIEEIASIDDAGRLRALAHFVLERTN